MLRWLSVCTLAVSVVGCRDTVDAFGDQAKSGGDATGGTASSETTGGGPDLPGGTETGDPDPCAKLDLLFVVDNTTSNIVIAQQAEMVIANIAGTVRASWDDFHIGVVRTNDTAGQCRQGGALSGQPNPGNPACAATAGNFASHEDGEMLESVLGCLSDLTTAEMPDTAPRVALAAGRGLDGTDVAALDPEFDAIQSDCNAGFVRPDAHHLLVVIASDDDASGEGSPGDPADWHAWLADYEAAGNLAIFSVLPRDEMACMQGAATRLVDWVSMFENTVDLEWCQFEPIAAIGALTAQISGGCGA